MMKNWCDAIVTDISLVMYVAPGTGRTIHCDRPFHGFVLNDSLADKQIHFSDGTILHTGPYELHYLPKGSTYRVEYVAIGGCWAINFDLQDDMDEATFSLRFRNYEPILNHDVRRLSMHASTEIGNALEVAVGIAGYINHIAPPSYEYIYRTS